MAALLAATACTADGRAGTSTAAGPAVLDGPVAWQPLGSDDVDLAYPLLGATREVAEQAALLGRAEELLAQRCMNSRGFAYAPTAPPASVDLAADEGSQYGLLPSALAAGAYAFARTEEEPTGANDRVLADLSPGEEQAWYDALLGTDEQAVEVPVAGGGVYAYNADGCLAQARVVLFPDRPAYLQAEKELNALAGGIIAAVASAPAFSEALSRWSACMSAQGHRYRSPQDAVSSMLSAAAPDPLASPDVRRDLAVLDAHCQETSGLWSVAAQLQDRATRAARAEHEAVFLAYAEAREAATDTAGRALAEA